jgi:hypothetical protein
MLVAVESELVLNSGAKLIDAGEEAAKSEH